jgi:type VI secretion system protein ImpG
VDDLTLRYFEAEMRYLRESGKEFSRAHPDRAAMLNMDRVGELDPMVERLFEGFAFLMGKLQQKLDDDLPELTEGLVSLLWPHYLRMIPSLTVVEFCIRQKSLQQAELVEQGTTLRSTPVGDENIRCLYRTTRPLTLLPLLVTEARLANRDDGRHAIHLTLKLEEQANRESLDLSQLRFFLCADTPIAFALMQALTQQAECVSLRLPGKLTIEPDVLSFHCSGFDPDDRLWPRPSAAHGGYPLLMEYFAFREKFLFVELRGLQVSSLGKTEHAFELEILLSQHFPAGMPFDASAFRLHCVPAINLFNLEAEPVHVNHLASEYRVVPMLYHGPHVETFSVDHVQAFDHGTGQRHEYVPFSSFRHRGGMLRHEAPECYYHARVRQGVGGLYETWLVLGGHAWHEHDNLTEETLSLRVTGTNGLLPRKSLRQAQLLEMTHEQSGVAHVRNLVAPTMPCHPPMEDRFHWRVLSHLAPNYISLLDAEVLRGTLALYDWTEDEMNRRRLQAITDVSHRQVKRVDQGCVLHGVEIAVTLDQAGFTGEGDLTLFGELLHHFFAGYADLNLFTRLVLLVQPSGKRIKWNDSKASRQPL